jgi:pimeloyl-ACP methyl ester carboxylesterase
MLALGEEAVLAIPDLASTSTQYPRCSARVNILAGDADIVALPHLHAIRLASILPNAELTLLPGMGHMLHHFAIDEVVAAVDRLSCLGASAKAPPSDVGEIQDRD